MKQSTIELWVGVFVAIGIAALVFLSLQVAGGTGGGTGNSGKTYTVYADFDDIGGLKTKAPVRIAGVVVGRVSNIGLNPETYRARVTLELSEQYKFSSDASAQILTSGILGEQYIGLEDGAEDDSLKNGDVISMTSSAMVLEKLVGKLITGFLNKQE